MAKENQAVVKGCGASFLSSTVSPFPAGLVENVCLWVFLHFFLLPVAGFSCLRQKRGALPARSLKQGLQNLRAAPPAPRNPHLSRLGGLEELHQE